MEISRDRLDKMSKEELIIWVNQELNNDHLKEIKIANEDCVNGYKNWTINFVMKNKAQVLNKSLIKIID